MRRGCRLLGCAALWALVFLGPIGWCQAAIVTMDLTGQIGGAPLPEGGPSWGTATFADVSSGVVKLTLQANLPVGYSIGGLGNSLPFGWGFNLDPGLNTQDLQFAYVSGNDAQILHAANNSYQAIGDGTFDFVFQWGWDITPDPLVGTQEAVYTISATGLSATSFGQMSSDGSGGYYSAARVKVNGSTYWVGAQTASESFVAIPEPATLVIWSVLGAGAGLGAMRRRRRARWSDENRNAICQIIEQGRHN